MYNSQYYTCEQIDQRLLQGYLDDYNTENGTSLTKEQFLTKLGNIFSKEGVIDNTVTQIGYYECDTAAGTAAKVITVTNYALFAGGSMKVKFANKNTANNATLNINSQGAKALYYQGERASATNSWDDNEVVEIYYDGTSYYANNVKGGSGSGVYDVSKEHPTSGPNSDGKFTLDYILNSSNVNELIPVNKRYPGMSIQFVSTYDNKYVQWRYMSSSTAVADFINTTNWQGVDDEPTAGSDNIVKSGGISSVSTTFNFVGIGNVYTEVQVGKAIAGHIYRVYPVVTSWDYGTTQDAAVIFQVGYINNEDTNVYTYTTKYWGGHAVDAYIDITIPSTVKSNTGLLIGGRAANGVKVWFAIEDITQVAINTEDIAELKVQVDDFENAAEIVEQLDSKINYTDNCYINSAGAFKTNSGYFVSDRVEVSNGDTVKWDYSNALQDDPVIALNIYNSEGVRLTKWAGSGNGSRTFTVSSEGAAYLRASFVKTTGYTPAVTINNRIAWTKQEDGTIVEYGRRLDALEAEVFPTEENYGVIGSSYPEQIPDIVTKLTYRFANRFHFIHISDNHNGSFGNADNLLDFIPAKFLVDTGDLVVDKFTDGATTTIALATGTIKPVYLVLGNHDYSNATSKQAVFDTFIGATNTHNGTTFDKTYYHVDFTTEGVKCIMLDLNEGHTDEELPELNPNTAIYGKMSQTQIEWFVAQLQDAITNNLHVIVFIHAIPSNEVPVFGKTIDSFLDRNYDGYRPSMGNSLYTCYRLDFLLDIVDAFINGSNVTFTYSEHEYSFTFASAGHFVAWFAGHLHYDAAGWLTGHENQFAINVCRPTANSGEYLGTYDGDKLGVHFNYVTIDKGLRSLSVYRVGQQDTVYATQRKSFRILYK